VRIVRRCAPLGAFAAALVIVLGSSSASTVAVRAAGTPRQLTRYSLVHRCYSLDSPSSGAPLAASDGPFTMQAAALGIYLLYGHRGDYLSDGGNGTLVADTNPTTASEWEVDGSSPPGFTITNVATHTRMPVSFSAATGCAPYPEAGVDATGTPAAGASAEASVLGTVEGHAHVTAFEFLGGNWHCGRPWSPFGAPYALPASCAADEQGTNGAFESFIDFGSPLRPQALHGWPTFSGWPSPTALAEEGDYYTGIERAWKAGLRLMVTQLVDNEALCSLMTTRRNECSDMASVRLQSADLYALQNYIDAQSGGPGKGWFRIVTDPFEARRVINQGKLAVIEGVEMSRIFGCGEVNGAPQCNDAQIGAGLNEFHALGIRTFFPIHEFDNAFGGTKGIAGDLGVVVNAGNRFETGSFWNLQPCSAATQDAEQVTVAPAGPIGQLLNGPVAKLLGSTPLPVYASGPQCNTRGLTNLGSYLINQMIKNHYIIQLDHMDSATATAALSIAESSHYSGVVSAHCCSSSQLFDRIYATGGFVTEPVAPAAAFIATERADKAESSSRYHFGFGWGSDMNGLADQPGPSPSTPITYPFKSYDGRVTFTREQWGDRSFDLNADGLANYGMYADYLQELQQLGGRPLMNDMFQGAEGYLQMWERAYGVPATRCLQTGGRFTGKGVGSLALGQTPTTSLYAAGQPVSRPGRAYRYCVAGRGTAAVAVFNTRGRIVLIGSTARGERAGALRIGSRVRAAGRRLFGSVWLARGGRYIYGTRRGHVRFVAAVTRTDARSHARLRSDLRVAALL
jgi:hypothetical protein